MKLKNTGRFLMPMIHVLVWIIVFTIPFFAWTGTGESFAWKRYLNFSFVPIVFMAVFYLNYLWLVDRFLFRKKTLAYILINLALIAVGVTVLYLWHEATRQEHLIMLREIGPDTSIGVFSAHDGPPGPPPREGEFFWGEGRGAAPIPLRMPGRWMSVLRDGAMLLLVAALALAIRMTIQWFRTEREKKMLEAARAEAELKNLKNQLNPHFLFNTLNNIYSLIEFNPEQARYAVESLSRMLRHVLYESGPENVPVEHEFAFMKSYIELMALRLPETAALEVDIPEDGQGVTIAPLLFINSVENAFKHGISSKKKSFIRIAIRIDGAQKITCTVENSCFPRTSRQMGSGIGLENLHRRLDLLYPDRYVLVNRQDGDTYLSTLEILL